MSNQRPAANPRPWRARCSPSRSAIAEAQGRARSRIRSEGSCVPHRSLIADRAPSRHEPSIPSARRRCGAAARRLQRTPRYPALSVRTERQHCRAVRPAGQRAAHRQPAGHPRPGRLHCRDRPPVLADEARHPLDLPGGRGRRGQGGGGRGHRPDQEDRQRRHRARRPRHGPGRRRDHRGHVRLVRPGPPRQPLVPRRGHRRVRERQDHHPRRLVRGRPGRRAAGHHAPRRPRPGHALPPGVLRRRGRGQRRGAQHRRAGRRCRPAATAGRC